MGSRAVLRSPVSEEEVAKLRAGDVVYLSGVVVTARDAAHRRVVRDRVAPPVDLRGLAVFHAGPVMVREGGSWRCVSIGPTTSVRMEPYEYEFLERTGAKVVIGKGGMGARTAEACRRFNAVYAIFPGGCGVLGASAVRRVLGVEWLDLGVPEALWVLEVEELGPLIVAIDSEGRNLTEEVLARARRAKGRAVEYVLERLKL